MSLHPIALVLVSAVALSATHAIALAQANPWSIDRGGASTGGMAPNAESSRQRAFESGYQRGFEQGLRAGQSVTAGNPPTREGAHLGGAPTPDSLGWPAGTSAGHGAGFPGGAPGSLPGGTPSLGSRWGDFPPLEGARDGERRGASRVPGDDRPARGYADRYDRDRDPVDQRHYDRGGYPPPPPAPPTGYGYPPTPPPYAGGPSTFGNPYGGLGYGGLGYPGLLGPPGGW